MSKSTKSTYALTVFIATAMTLNGCATQPSNVAASHVSSIKYDNVDCARLAIEASDVEQKLSSTTARLQSAANSDAGLVAAGFLFFPLWFGTAATGGKAEEQELARLKGEKIALDGVSLRKNCGVAEKSPATPVIPVAAAIVPVK